MDLRPAAICLYGLLTTAHGIRSPSVYAVQNDVVVIDYGYSDQKGNDATHEIFLRRRPLDGKYLAVGMYPVEPDPVTGLTDQMQNDCGIIPGYVDEVAITRQDQLVDMSKVAK